MFALDVFSIDAPWQELLGGFLMHLIPSFVTIIAGIVAWRNPKIGGILLILIGITFSISFRNISAFLLIALPLILIGALFLWKKK
jgi:hypothetical protein